MTLDEGMAKVERQIDAILERVYDDDALYLISIDTDPDFMADLLAEQRARAAAWRLIMLDQVRGWLATEFA